MTKVISEKKSRFINIRIAVIDNLILILLLLTASYYLIWPALAYPLHGDDFGYLEWILFDISKNPLLVFHKIYHTFYRPMMLLMTMVVFKRAGTDPVPYHLLSMFLHISITLGLRSFLVFLAGTDRTKPLMRAGATIFALYFFTHFRNAQTVLWYASIKELMAGGFVLGSFYAAARSRSAFSLAVSWIFCALGILTLESLLIMPLVVCCLILLSAGKERRWSSSLLRCLPFVLLIVIYLSFYVYFSARPGGAHADKLFNESFAAAQANIVVWFLKSLLPWNLELHALRQLRSLFINHPVPIFLILVILVSAVALFGKSMLRITALLTVLFCFPYVIMFSPSFEGGRLFYNSLIFLTATLFLIFRSLVTTYSSKWIPVSTAALLAIFIAFNSYSWDRIRIAMRRMAVFNTRLYVKMLTAKTGEGQGIERRLIIFGNPIIPASELQANYYIGSTFNVLKNTKTVRELLIASCAIWSKNHYEIIAQDAYFCMPFRRSDIIINHDGKEITLLSIPEAEAMVAALMKQKGN